jgi:DNA (cytosine-5)-methyltransferase 1
VALSSAPKSTQKLIHGIALCAGVGMLDEGVRLAFGHLGWDYRTVCYVEREAPAAAQLVVLMEAQLIDPAPVWDDLVSFDGRRWRRRVDCLTAGFPCQPHSVAGKRDGLTDERWIWPDIARLVGDIRPYFVLLENVPGLVSTGGLNACLGDLAALGYDAEWGLLSAADVGAAHQRERLFILAYAPRHERDGSYRQGGRRRGVRQTSGALANALSGRRDGRTDGAQRRALERIAAEGPGGALGDTAGERWGERRPELQWPAGRPDSAGSGGAVDERRDAGDAEQQTNGAGGVCPAFAPGPDDPSWPSLIAAERIGVWQRAGLSADPGECPWAPATQPGVRLLVDGLALVVDESRSDQLRAIGNGVVALTAACAYVQLAWRAGVLSGEDEIG